MEKLNPHCGGVAGTISAERKECNIFSTLSFGNKTDKKVGLAGEKLITLTVIVEPSEGHSVISQLGPSLCKKTQRKHIFIGIN